MARADPTFFPKLLTLFGITLFFLGRLIQNYSSPFVLKELPQTITYHSPKKIVIEKINLNLPIKSGGVVYGNWVLTYDNAHFIVTSGLPGEGFNTVIYAHRLPNLFGNLEKVNLGDIITLESETGKKFNYQVFEKQAINPREINKLKSSIENVLTLFTCDGWFDKSRLVVRAKMIDQTESSFPIFSFQEPKPVSTSIPARFLLDLH